MTPQRAEALEKLVDDDVAPSRPLSPTGRRIIVWLIVLLILAAAGIAAFTHWAEIQAFFTGGQAQASARQSAANRPVPVVAAYARTGDVHVYLAGLGTVTPFYTVTVHTRVDGQIMKIIYQEGQLVQKGEQLVLIDPRPYQVQLEQAQGNLLKDQAYLDNAKIDLQRYLDAFKNGGAVSDQQVKTQEATVHQYEGIVVSDQAAVDAAKLDLVYCQVNSPITGVIGLQQINEGNIVQTTDTTGLAVITQLQPIAVVFALPEDDLDQVVTKPQGGVGLSVQAYDADDRRLIATGTVIAVDNQVDPTTGTFKIKASFENKDKALYPNQFVNAHLLANTLHNSIIVPTTAVQYGPNSETFVFVVEKGKSPQTRPSGGGPAGIGGVVHIRNVQVGAGEADFVAVTGIQPGELVVTDGTDKLQDGTKVVATLAAPIGGAAPSTRPAGRSSHRRQQSEQQ